MPDYMCQYGNCDNTDTPILATDKLRAERNRFCCYEHLALWALQWAWRTELKRDPVALARVVLQIVEGLPRA